MTRLRAQVALAIAFALVAAATAVAGAAAIPDRRTAPASFGLVFVGRHTPTLLHEGTFTTTASFCPSGFAADASVEVDVETATRVFKCAGSSDQFTARVWPLPSEHGGSGSWQIVDGEGALATLRGKGTWTSVRLSGTSEDLEHITFRRTWQGLTGFDTSAPTVAVKTSHVTKLRRPKGTFVIRLGLSFAGEGDSAISYEVTIVDPRTRRQFFRSAQTTTGKASVSVRLRPTQRTRILRIAIAATDAVGNASALSKTLRIR